MTHCDPDGPPEVLVVEDDPSILFVLREALEAEGYQVLEADNAPAALAALADHPAIALLITDILMPGVIDGQDLMRHVRRSLPDMPVIVLSGSEIAASEEILENARVLIKPFDPDELVALVERRLAP
jgi:CheY-like chemotaxis protein